VRLARLSARLGRAPGAARSLLYTTGVRVIDDPYDPVFVTTGPAPGRVELQIGETRGSRYVRLHLEQARALAKALLEAAELIERERRRA
jgi:hypothetical protein